MRGYLTPDSTPAGLTCRVLFIPDDREWVAQVYGALETLTIPGAWTQYGSVTPEDTAAEFKKMWYKLLDNQRGCRMIGEIILWAGGDPTDTGLLLCDGSSYERTDYPALYDVLDAAFIVDADNFVTPDLRGRVAIGASTDFAIGDTGGETEHTLDTSEMPSHAHTDTGHIHPLAGEVPGLALAPGELPVDVPGSTEVTGIGYAAIGDTGGGGAHNNMQPYLALRYYIQAV